MVGCGGRHRLDKEREHLGCVSTGRLVDWSRIFGSLDRFFLWAAHSRPAYQERLKNPPDLMFAWMHFHRARRTYITTGPQPWGKAKCKPFFIINCDNHALLQSMLGGDRFV